MTENGMSEEELTVFTKNMNDIMQQAFQLKEELADLTNQTKNLPSKREELTTLEQRRKEMKERHKQNLKIFRDELSNKQKEAIEQQEKTSQKVAELNKTVSDLNQKIKEKEEKCDQLKIRIKSFDSKQNSINQEIEDSNYRAKELKPLQKYIKNFLPIPMYIEDLTMKNYLLKKVYDTNQVDITNLNAKIASLESKDEGITQQIESKKKEKANAKEKLANSRKQYEEVELEISKTKKTLEDTNKLLENARQAKESAKLQRKQDEAKYQSDKNSLLEELADLRKKQEDNAREIEEIKGESSKELSNFDERIKDMRKKISLIKDSGIDPDSPSVDSDLQSQIVMVTQDKKDLAVDMEKMDASIRQLRAQIEEKNDELCLLALKMKPTQKILQMPEFAEKMVLLEELVIQNKNLKDSFVSIANRVEILKKENSEIRSSFRKKMDKK